MEEELQEIAILSFLKRNLLIVSLIGIGIVFSLIGGIQYLASNQQKSLEFIKSDESQTGQVAGVTSTPNLEKKVDIEGEVLNPGVYTLKNDARVKDAIDAAGGLSIKADKEYISKNLNLAQKISDGAKIYIPKAGENIKNVQIMPQIIQENTISDTTSSLININSALETALDTLPKIGPVTAQKIIAGRPYSSIDELVLKKVVTQKVFEGIKDKITAQ